MEPPQLHEEKDVLIKKPAGWKAMPYIIGNETFERFATVGLASNLSLYLTREYNMGKVNAATLLSVWSGLTGFAPLAGAYLSDTYTGRYRIIAVASFFTLAGMVMMTLTAAVPSLQPPQCDQPGQCASYTGGQLGFVLLGLGLITIGSGGIRPCSMAFGVDQFDPKTEEGAKGIASYFNWYYTTFTFVGLLNMTVIAYIQVSVSWALGFAIPTGAMFFSVILFFMGKNIYVRVRPEGSIFKEIGQVIVAAYKKRRLGLPEEDDRLSYYDPSLKGTTVLSKLPLTNQFRYLNKAAIIEKDNFTPEGTVSTKQRLCTIQQVEELKCLIRIVPIWASGIISIMSMSQQSYTTFQATIMNLHFGSLPEIPPTSIFLVTGLTLVIFIPIYDRVLVPNLRKITKHELGITLLQRMGIGIVFSVLSMVVAGLVERYRRASATPISVFWLAPQLILLGLCESFNMIGQIEFYNRQFPEHMRSIANALLSLSSGLASFCGTFVITAVHNLSGDGGRGGWLAEDLNEGKLDYFYFFAAGLGVLNFFYFLYVARKYRYRGSSDKDVGESEDDVELNGAKN